MLKIALLITGTIRNYKENYITWKKYLLDKYFVDIFFHTYNIIGYHNDIHKNCFSDSLFNEIELLKIIKPTKYKIDNFDDKLKEFKDSVISQCLTSGSPKPEFIKSQLYSIYIANQLKLEYEKINGSEYDLVIKIRFDTIFYSSFDISDIIKVYSSDNIILCGNPNINSMKYKNACKKCIKYNKKCNSHDIISDIVFISTSKSINYYANIYLEYDKFIRDMFKKAKKNIKNLEKYKDTSYKSGCIYYDVPKIECPYPEKILAKYLHNYILLNYSINLDINRNTAC